jgi:V/A-type H+-transporting ATPase subunit E
MGLDKVVKDILDKAEVESKNIGAKAAADAAAEKQSAEAQAREIAEMSKADLAIPKMRQRELSSAKLDVKKAKLNAEKDVLAEVHAEYVKRLAALPREKKVDIINKLIGMARKEIPAGKIYTNAADSDLVNGSGYEYGGNINCTGGIVVTSSDGSVNLDYTFDSILEDVWNSSMKPVSDILFGNR